MSSSQPGPYQSRLLSGVVRQARQWIDQASVAFRRLQTGANWTAQAVLFPIYVAFQTVRLVGAQLRQAVGLGVEEVKAIAQDGQSPNPSASLTADTPIQQALLTVQSFSLSVDLPVLVEAPLESSVVPEVKPQPEHLLSRLIASTIYPWLQKLVRRQTEDTAGSELTATASYFSSASAPGELSRRETQLSQVKQFVRGIASLTETRALVLVTNQNEVLDILTGEQQLQLRQRISWETAHYGRYLRLRLATREALLRPTSTNPNVLLPVRLFRSLMAWVQSGQLAIAANLFQEAPSSAIAGAEPPKALPGGFRFPALPFQNLRFPALKPTFAITKRGTASLQLTAAPANSSTLAVPSLATSLTEPASTSLPQFLQPDTADYLETDAISIGYALSPLDQLLRWVDQCLLWLEKWLVALWNWFVGLMRSKE